MKSYLRYSTKLFKKSINSPEKSFFYSRCFNLLGMTDLMFLTLTLSLLTASRVPF